MTSSGLAFNTQQQYKNKDKLLDQSPYYSSTQMMNKPGEKNNMPATQAPLKNRASSESFEVSGKNPYQRSNVVS